MPPLKELITSCTTFHSKLPCPPRISIFGSTYSHSLPPHSKGTCKIAPLKLVFPPPVTEKSFPKTTRTPSKSALLGTENPSSSTTAIPPEAAVNTSLFGLAPSKKAPPPSTISKRAPLNPATASASEKISGFKNILSSHDLAALFCELEKL